jgi:methyl-accepting chemotaxis protein
MAPQARSSTPLHSPALTPGAGTTLPRGVPVAPSLFEEEKAKDLALIKHTGKNRVRITLLLGALFAVANLLGVVDGTLWMTALVSGTALLFNVLFAAVTRRVYLRFWRYGAAILDSAMISCAVFLGGKPILVVIYFLSIVPYALDRGAAVGQVATLAGVAGFLGALWAHAQVNQEMMPWNDAMLAALLLVLAAQQAIGIPARLEGRMRRARAQMALVERGDLSVRMAARHDDELGFLERSLNRMLDELTAVIETVQREAEALVQVAGEMEGTMAALRGRSGEVSSGAHSLRVEVARQRSAVREGMQASQEAARSASDARAVALANRAAAQQMDAVMVASRESIDEAAQMLLVAGGSVEAAAERVRRLGPASEQVGEFVARVARIARQTNLLALNAAIEAARAGEEGAGFAVVADEIRALATESAQASKLIAATVQRVREEMAEAVRAMDDTTSGLSGARTIAQEARQALTTLVGGMAQVAERAERVTALSEEQEARSRMVAGTFDALEGVSQRANVEARRAAEGTAGQQANIEALAVSAMQLSESAQRLRVVARTDWYRLMRTGVHAAVDAASIAGAKRTSTGVHAVVERPARDVGRVASPTPVRPSVPVGLA